MEFDETILKLGKLTEEMYFNIEKVHHSEMQDQLVEYHAKVIEKLNSIYAVLEKANCGDLLIEFKKKIKVLIDDFVGMEDEIDSKYKVYLRGCGNAGKSTLLNALLSLDEECGSRMGRLPMTFTIDTYSDEMEKNQAEIRTIDINGNCKRTQMTRSKAIVEQDSEEESFRKSKAKCDALIEGKTKEVHLEDVIEDIKHDIYKRNILKTSIREIKWGIGKNNFFHNCILVDTPGLSQDLRFTNVLEEIKNYEVDGLVWVIASNKLSKSEVIESYEKEFEEFKNVYKGKKVIGVVNMYGTGAEFEYGSKTWKKIQKVAEAIYCKKYGFDNIILVNAKLAYDGSLDQSSEMLEKSNINELRKKINEMFIEKTSKEHFTGKLKQIDLFLDNFIREVEEACHKLEKSISEYQDKKNKIVNQKTNSERQLRDELDSAVKNHMKLVNNRIDQNMTRVNSLHQESKLSQNAFIRENILEPDKLEKQVGDITIKHYHKIVERFEKLQKGSVMSEFRTEQYAITVFQEKYNMALITKKIGRPDLVLPDSIGDSAANFLEDLFGESVASMFNGIRNLFVSPKERLIKKSRQSLSSWVNKVNLDKEINDYVNQCMSALDKSMLHTYGANKDVVETEKQMNDFINTKPQMEWVDIKLEDIIGGVQDV